MTMTRLARAVASIWAGALAMLALGPPAYAGDDPSLSAPAGDPVSLSPLYATDPGGYCDGGSFCTSGVDGVCYAPESPISLERCDDGCGFCDGESWCTCGPFGVCYAPGTPISVEHCGGECGSCVGESWCTCGPDGVCYAPGTPISVEHCGGECGFCDGGSWCTCGPDGVCYAPNTPISVEHCGGECGFCDGASWCTCGPDGVCYAPGSPISVDHCGLPCVTPPGGMIAWWPLDETSGTTSHEIIHSFNGTHTNGPSPTPGMVAGALWFDGVDDHVLAPKPSSYVHDYQNLTIDAWIRPDSLPAAGSWANVVAYGFPGGMNMYNLLLDSHGELAFATQPSPTSYYVHTTGASIPLGGWTFVAATASNTTGQIRLFINGAMVYSYAGYSSTGYSALTNGFWGIGGPEDMFNGVIDEVEIFERALDDSEIAMLYGAGSWGKCKPGSIPPFFSAPYDNVTAMGSGSLFGNTP